MGQGSQDEGYLQPSALGLEVALGVPALGVALGVPALGVALRIALGTSLEVAFEGALGLPSGG